MRGDADAIALAAGLHLSGIRCCHQTTVTAGDLRGNQAAVDAVASGDALADVGQEQHLGVGLDATGRALHHRLAHQAPVDGGDGRARGAACAQGPHRYRRHLSWRRASRSTARSGHIATWPRSRTASTVASICPSCSCAGSALQQSPRRGPSRGSGLPRLITLIHVIADSASLSYGRSAKGVGGGRPLLRSVRQSCSQLASSKRSVSDFFIANIDPAQAGLGQSANNESRSMRTIREMPLQLDVRAGLVSGAGGRSVRAALAGVALLIAASVRRTSRRHPGRFPYQQRS